MGTVKPVAMDVSDVTWIPASRSARVQPMGATRFPLVTLTDARSQGAREPEALYGVLRKTTRIT